MEGSGHALGLRDLGREFYGPNNCQGSLDANKQQEAAQLHYSLLKKQSLQSFKSLHDLSNVGTFPFFFFCPFHIFFMGRRAASIAWCSLWMVPSSPLASLCLRRGLRVGFA